MTDPIALLADAMNPLRRIGIFRDTERKILVSTVRIYGREHYETAIEHPEYAGGELITADTYYTEESARTGHVWWIKILTEGSLPERIGVHKHGSKSTSDYIDEGGKT